MPYGANRGQRDRVLSRNPPPHPWTTELTARLGLGPRDNPNASTDVEAFNRREVLMNECAGGRPVMSDASLFSANLRNHRFHIDFNCVMET